ncbi:MAG: hypothetical protein Q9220_007434 [cf. Caloplaca sp. 1 TL-2023]
MAAESTDAASASRDPDPSNPRSSASNAADDALPISETASPTPQRASSPSTTAVTPSPAESQPSPTRIINQEALHRLRQQHALSLTDSEPSSSASSEDEAPESPAALTFAPTSPDASARNPEMEVLRLSELVPPEALAQCSTINGDWTLADFINYVIDNDIMLPSEEQMYGDPARNVAEVEEHAGLIDCERSMERIDATLAACRPADSGQGRGIDLNDVGMPLYYEDPLTGKIRRRAEQSSSMDSLHPASVDAAAEQGLDGVRSGMEGIG